ncbi:MAG: carboxypeptidase M32 [Oscillospiraceae bacterium]|nr:carboxypeptidase M32 [Oscillospiraceae bacterium]
MTTEEAIERLYALQKKLSAYSHAMGLLNYDGVTTAPKGTAANRGETMGVLSEELYRLTTGPDTVELLEFLAGQRESLGQKDRRIVYLMLKDIRRMQAIPMEEYIAYQMLLVEADDVWHKAKEQNDWPAFRPYLERIFDTARRFAGYCNPEKDPYDYWLNEFEEGIDQKSCDSFFSALRERIIPLLRRVLEKPQLSDSAVLGSFPAADQERFSLELMELIGLDLDHVGLSVTEHPFTTSLGSHLDERITTHYHEDNFTKSMFSVIHEGGHALYDTGSAPELARTVLDCGVSMGIHESQSRFFENFLGRSRAFCSYILPVARRYFPEQLAQATPEALYRAVNRAQPGPVRIEADELTYPLHIMIRYELEKQVMSGALAVAELPEAWNRLYKKYLGVDVPDDRHGVLQDSHWAGGLIGYFPSYALGSAYGAQYLRRMRESVDVDGCLAKGDFGPIDAWLRERIWRFGCLYTPGELFRNAVGEDFDPNVFTDYLEQKYTELYGL